MLTPIQLSTLKSQLDTTYSGKSNGTAHAEINDPDGPNAVTNFAVQEVSAADAVAAVVGAEFMALSAAAQRGWLMITTLGSIPVRVSAIRSLIAAIWGVGTTTRTNLQALQERKGSHAEALFGVRVSMTNIRKARKI